MVSGNKERTKRKAPPHAWKPGQSGNPDGRPRDQFSFMGILRSVLAEENAAGHSVGERIIRRYVKLALAGNPQALEAIMARIDGKPAQSVTLKGDTDAPLHVRHSARLGAEPSPELPAPGPGRPVTGDDMVHRGHQGEDAATADSDDSAWPHIDPATIT